MTEDEKNNENESISSDSVNDDGVNDERQDLPDEMDREDASREELRIQGGEPLSAEETLSDPEDNAEVDSEELRREVEGGEDIELEDPPERDYAIGSNMVRNLFIGGGIGAVVVVVVILTLTSAIDQARYTPADETQYRRTLAAATEELSSYAQNENGRASIPIEQAIALTAERGLNEINAELGVSLPQSGQQGAQATQEQAQTVEQGEAQQASQEQAQQGDMQEQGETQQAEQAQGEGDAQPQAGQDVPEVLTAGESVYTANCVSCHQANGQGIPGAFPTLVDHTPLLYNADRSYLINLQLYGLQGEIQVQGQSYNGVMPAWAQLSDQEIADVLNYVSTAWDNNQDLQNFQSYTPEEVAEARGKGLSSSGVYELRPSLQ